MSYARFAIYFVPPDGALADFGARWLGWDIRYGRVADQLDMPGLRDITMTPRKYGFHGTLKPPFRLADGNTPDELERAVSAMAEATPRAVCDGLALTQLGGFLALTPTGDTNTLAIVASACVQELDAFRAPAGEAELARRRAAGLTDRQEGYLHKWGYPYVMDEFRFHLTLSGRLTKDTAAEWSGAVESVMPALPVPFVVDQVALCGERDDGRFELLHRYALAN